MKKRKILLRNRIKTQKPNDIQSNPLLPTTTATTITAMYYFCTVDPILYRPLKPVLCISWHFYGSKVESKV